MLPYEPDRTDDNDNERQKEPMGREEVSECFHEGHHP